MKRVPSLSSAERALVEDSSKPQPAAELSAAPPAPSQARWLKPTALTLMLIQNASFVLVMRFSRKQQAGASAAMTYSIGMVVTLQEAFKLLICMLVLGWPPTGSMRAALAPLTRPRDLLRIAVPAVCFTLQNNILYVALSNLDPLTFQITYQLKTLLTALFSVALLGKQLSQMQWLSQLVLTLGIVLVQLNDAPSSRGGSATPPRRALADVGGVALAPPAAMTAPPPAPPPAAAADSERSLVLGLAAVLIAALSSAFASVYFERLLKEKSPPAPADASAAHASAADGAGAGAAAAQAAVESGGGTARAVERPMEESSDGAGRSSSSGGAGARDGAGAGAVIDGKLTCAAEPPPTPPATARPAASLWVRNIELSAWTVPLNLLLALVQSRHAPGGLLGLCRHPLQGFEPSTWGVIVVNGFGGLLVAIVIKYADNIWKGFATAGAIILTGAIAPILDLGPPPSLCALLGTALVVASVFMYAMPPRTVPRAQPGREK